MLNHADFEDSDTKTPTPEARGSNPPGHTTSRQVPRFQSPRKSEGFFMLYCRSFSPRGPLRWARAGARF